MNAWTRCRQHWPSTCSNTDLVSTTYPFPCVHSTSFLTTDSSVLAVFPLFWAVGAAILFTDLNPIPESECGKTAEDQAEQLEIMRREEIKWARRSLYALGVLFALLALVAVVVGVVILHRR